MYNYLSSMGLSGGRVLSSTHRTSKVMNQFLMYQIIIEIHFCLEMVYSVNKVHNNFVITASKLCIVTFFVVFVFWILSQGSFKISLIMPEVLLDNPGFTVTFSVSLMDMQGKSWYRLGRLPDFVTVNWFNCCLFCVPDLYYYTDLFLLRWVVDS